MYTGAIDTEPCIAQRRRYELILHQAFARKSRDIVLGNKHASTLRRPTERVGNHEQAGNKMQWMPHDDSEKNKKEARIQRSYSRIFMKDEE